MDIAKMNPTEQETYEMYFMKYHNDRIAVLSETERQVTCKGCTNEMSFMEGPTTLTYSCGSKGKGKCGDQYVIHLPHYVDYHSSVKMMTDSINGNLPYNDDPEDVSQQDLEELHKLTDLPLTEELAHQREMTETCEKDLKRLHKMYETQNEERQKKERVKELAALRSHLHDEKLRIQKRLSEENDIPMIR